MKKITTYILLILGISASAQTNLTLNDVLNIAQSQSLDAFKHKNMYRSSYWAYKSYKSGQLPHLNLYLNPTTYNRSMVSRYDSERNIDVYREQQTLSSYAGLSLSLVIAPTGGQIYLQSDIYRIQNYGASDYTSWSSTPIKFGFTQPLFAHNEYKWEKLTAPLLFEQAKQTYIQTSQSINIEASQLYFDLLLAKVNVDMAQSNIQSTSQQLTTGKERFTIASIKQEELYKLELNKLNADIALVKAQKEFDKAQFSLRSFLGFDQDQAMIPEIPEIEQDLYIDEQQAIAFAQKFNPEMIELRYKQIEAAKALDQAKKEARFSADLNMSYGLNQSSETFDNVYTDPIDQQMVSVSLVIPILDWGDSKGQRMMAESEKEVVDIEVKQASIDFEQDVRQKVLDFNIQSQMISSAKKAFEISAQSYKLTESQFTLGNTDVLTLTTSMEAWQQAWETYIESLSTYWKYLFELQEFTLYDFQKGTSIEQNFEQLIQQSM